MGVRSTDYASLYGADNNNYYCLILYVCIYITYLFVFRPTLGCRREAERGRTVRGCCTRKRWCRIQDRTANCRRWTRVGRPSRCQPVIVRDGRTPPWQTSGWGHRQNRAGTGPPVKLTSDLPQSSFPSCPDGLCKKFKKCHIIVVVL